MPKQSIATIFAFENRGDLRANATSNTLSDIAEQLSGVIFCRAATESSHQASIAVIKNVETFDDVLNCRKKLEEDIIDMAQQSPNGIKCVRDNNYNYHLAVL